MTHHSAIAIDVKGPQNRSGAGRWLQTVAQ